MLKRLQGNFRAIKKNKATLATNIIGMSIGLATTFLLVVFILHEWSYDRYFTKADNIHRLHTIWITDGDASVFPINLRKAYTEIPQNVPGIDETVQIYKGGNVILNYSNTNYGGNNLLYVDSTFFKIFDFKIIEGQISDVLNKPNSIVITRKIAQRIFGNVSPIGKGITKDGDIFTITAVAEDVPVNTHFSFDILMSMDAVPNLEGMGGLEFFTYYLYNPNADEQELSKNICANNNQILKERFKSSSYSFSSEIEPLKRLHLNSNTSFDLGIQGSIKTIMLVGIIAFLVMFLALTNFVNLFIIEGEQRAKEIGVRKVNGAGKAGIIRQFFTETSIIVAITFIIGTFLAILLLPQFGNLMQRDFSLGLLKSPLFIFSLLGIFIITVFLSGSYPAFYLSKFNPAVILKSQSGKRIRKKYVMNLVSGLQLAVTIFLLTYLFGINTQIQYLKNSSPGFNPSGLVNIYNLNDNIKSHYPAIHDQLLQLPGVEGVAASSHTIGGGYSGQGIRLIESPENEIQSINEYRIQPGLCNLLEVELKEGRFFDPERENDRNGVILNESAVKMLGLSDAIGQQVVMFDDPLEIIGIVKDFRYESAAHTIRPMVLTDYSTDMRTIMVRISSDADFGLTLKKMEDAIKTFDSGYIFSTGNTLDIYNNYYADEERLEQLTQLGAALSIVIVMMGIFMLVSQSIARRTKEIGIRKTLGGSTTKMMGLIYATSLKWTIIASIVAVPLSYFMLQNWLQNFAVKASLGWWLFLEGVVIVVVLETIITFFQTWKAANQNPVEALRYE